MASFILYNNRKEICSAEASKQTLKGLDAKQTRLTITCKDCKKISPHTVVPIFVRDRTGKVVKEEMQLELHLYPDVKYLIAPFNMCGQVEKVTSQEYRPFGEESTKSFSPEITVCSKAISMMKDKYVILVNDPRPYKSRCCSSGCQCGCVCSCGSSCICEACSTKERRGH